MRFNRVFGYGIEVSHAHVAKVPAEYIRRQTLVGAERYVTTELKEYESRVLGAEERMARLELELFGEIRAAVAAEAPALGKTARAVGALDALVSLAEVAHERGHVRPEIDGGKGLEITDGRHPVLEMGGERPFTPNDLRLDPEAEQVIILTGPNMSGKSVFMRQAALLVILAQMGAFVPARAARIGVVDRILTRVGAQDNLARGQSTFLVEMVETASILHHATDRSLILLDEVGRGTSTFDGLAIAWAVTEALHDRGRGAKVLFATHYHELTALAETLPRVRNYHVAVKEWNDEIIFLHKVRPGGTDRSYGIQVARLAGLPPAVISRAREILAELESHPASIASIAPARSASGPARTLSPRNGSPPQGAGCPRRLVPHAAPGPQPPRGVAAAPEGPAMSAIRLLPELLINKIAAGEVVERPASVVKELVENAIDAGARSITVELKDAGRQLIRVTDDGVGMTGDDLDLALQRHATSKIADESDLDAIGTLGFRGEALPAICAVSRFEIRSCPRGSAVGTLLRGAGGAIEARLEVATDPGTAVETQDLFFNTPARLKFLRSAPSELAFTLRLLQGIALSRPDLHIRVLHHGKPVLAAPVATTLRDRVGALLGFETSQAMLEVRHSQGVVRITGLVAPPQRARGNRDEITLIVNGRPVRDTALTQSLIEGYRPMLARHQFPVAVLAIELPLPEVDVNVHPTKAWVRFRSPRFIQEAVFRAVQDALRSQLVVQPQQGLARPGESREGDVASTSAGRGEHGGHGRAPAAR